MTIEEMAKNSLKEKGYLLTSFDGAHMAEIEATAMFKRGANEVLDEFEKVYNSVRLMSDCSSTSILYKELGRVINELMDK